MLEVYIPCAVDGVDTANRLFPKSSVSPATCQAATHDIQSAHLTRTANNHPIYTFNQHDKAIRPVSPDVTTRHSYTLSPLLLLVALVARNYDRVRLTGPKLCLL
jgi:hypothetical protein